MISLYQQYKMNDDAIQIFAIASEFRQKHPYLKTEFSFPVTTLYTDAEKQLVKQQVTELFDRQQLQLLDMTMDVLNRTCPANSQLCYWITMNIVPRGFMGREQYM